MSAPAPQPRRGGIAALATGTLRNRTKASTKQNAVNGGSKATNAFQEVLDECGAELEEHARVWKVYVEEAEKFDTELVDGWNRADPKSTDTALQAIAGADPDDVDPQLLKNSKADKMILTRLLNLDSDSKNYDQILGLYTRAQSFFQTSTPANEKVPPISNGEVREESTKGPQKKLNGELQRKLRTLRNTIYKKITVYATSDNAFLPSIDNTQALRIGSTATSYCLQSLQNGAQALTQTEERFETAIDLLERYKDREIHLGNREIQYMMAGTAMLLSSLLVDCPPASGAQYVMRLLRIFGRAGDGQNQLQLGYLPLPMAVYALSRYDYPGWTQPPPLNSLSRAERAIEMIEFYVSHPSDLTEATSIMTNLGLLELLSNPEEYRLDGSDIEAISGAFIPVGDLSQAHIHTFSPGSHLHIYSRMLAMISNERHALFSRDTVTIAYLTALDRASMDLLAPDDRLGDIYAFVIESVLNLPSSDPEAYGPNVALDLMQKFHEYPGRTREPILALGRSLGKRGILAKLKEASEVEKDANIVRKSFATGQAWFLTNLAIQSETADHQDWSGSLSPFIQNGSASNLAMKRLIEQRDILADRYRTIWKNDNMRRHNYLEILYNLLPPIGTSEDASH
ncbi:hypothetical protein FRC11_008075 [Ceratobasidium sp. 423]|nr:hypothetical protein FRC11_008075 [Ceratobasidium sp. 423]